MGERADWLAKARHGDREAFERLVGSPAERARLMRIARRFVGQPDDCDDVVQEALVRAYEKVGQVRSVDALSGWLSAITVRCALDHLRKRKRWRPDAQVHLKDAIYAHPDELAEVQAHRRSEEHRFDAREHIAYCFTCVARSLPEEEHGALILKDVLGYTSMEAAKTLGMNESTLRHRLSAARASMQSTFDGLCGIVSKDGVCHQCAGLRESTPEERRGPPVPELGPGEERTDRYRRRLTVVRDAEPHEGDSQRFHDFLYRKLAALEEAHR